MNFFNPSIILCDSPQPWGVYFQDTTSPQMEALLELHDNMMFYLVIILVLTGWTLVCIIINYVYPKSPVSNKYLNHGTLIKFILNITPAIITILFAFPWSELLYLKDEVTYPYPTAKVYDDDEVTDRWLTGIEEARQWHLSYEYRELIDDEYKMIFYLIIENILC